MSKEAVESLVTVKGKSKKVVGTAKAEGRDGKALVNMPALPGTNESAISLVKTPKPVGPYMGDQVLDDEIAAFLRRSQNRQKGAFDTAMADGEDVHRLVGMIEGDKFKGLRRRPNSTSPFDIIAKHPDSTVGDKQLRRQEGFYLQVTRIREAGLVPPMLGVTHYAEVSVLKSLESMVATLRQAERDGLSVRELIDIVAQMPSEQKKAPRTKQGRKDGKAFFWQKELKAVVGVTTKRLAQIDEAMIKAKSVLLPEDAKNLRKVVTLINSILKRIS